MKQKDIALIIVVAFISAIVAFLVTDKIFVTPSNRQQQVEVVQPITDEFPKLDQKYFNNSSIDPAPNNQPASGNNTNPFNGSSQ